MFVGLNYGALVETFAITRNYAKEISSVMKYIRCERCGAEIRPNMECCPICGYHIHRKEKPEKEEKAQISSDVVMNEVAEKKSSIGKILGIIVLVMFVFFIGTQSAMLFNVVRTEEEQKSGTLSDNNEESNDEALGVADSDGQDVNSDVNDGTGYLTLYCGVTAPASDFMFAKSSSDLLTTADLVQLYDEDPVVRKHRAQFAINEIFARYGYVFTSSSDTAEEARRSFGDKEWYIEAQKSCPDRNQEILRADYFNKFEKANILTLLEWEEKNVPEGT